MPLAGDDGLFLTTRLPPFHQGNFGQQNSVAAAAAFSQPTHPFASMLSQNLGALDQAGASQQITSLEQHLLTLQRQSMNQPQGVQHPPYPNSWFSMNSQGGALQSLLDRRLSMASMTPDTATDQSMIPPASFLANHLSLIDSSSHSLRTAGALHPQPVASEISATAPVTAAINDMDNEYQGNDNPFEPVPIAEDISRRHSEGK